MKSEAIGSSTLTSSACLIRIPLIFALLSCFCQPISGQIAQTARLEIPIIEDGERSNFTVVTARENGLVVYREHRLPNAHVFELLKLDTALHELWRGTLNLDLEQAPFLSSVHKNILFVLCKNTTPGKGDLSLLTVNLATRDFRVYPILNYIPFVPTDMLALGDAVMIGGSFNYRPFILHFSLTEKKSKILPGFFNEQGELLQMRTSDDTIVDVVISAKNQERKKSLWIRNYDRDGSLLKTTVLEPEDGKHLLMGRSIMVPGDTEVVAGVYGKSTGYSRGLFVGRIEVNGEYKITYYNFAELKNFFHYMKIRRQLRVRSRIERRNMKGRKNRFNYRVLVHQLIPYGNQYVLLGEAYFPTYRSQSGGGGGGFASTSRGYGNAMAFDGYQYTHAIVIGFSKEGKMLWDNSFEINDVKSFKLDQFVKIQPEKDHINLVYLIGNSIHTKIIRGDKVVEGKSRQELQVSRPGEKLPFGDVLSPTKLEYWYRGVLYAYGTQTTLNETNSGGVQQRNVFFINKIADK